MEIFFDIAHTFLLISLIGLVYVSITNSENVKKSSDILHEEHKEKIDLLMEDVDRLEIHVAKLCQQMDALPDVIKDDNHRSMLDLRASLEAAKPIRPNNWDSMKEAFKGPARNELNERDRAI
jgi:hypothetical protein